MIIIVASSLYFVLSLIFGMISTFGVLVYFSVVLLMLTSYAGLPFSSLNMIIAPIRSFLDEFIITLNLILVIVVFFRFLVFKLKLAPSTYIENLGILRFILLFVASLVVFSSSSLFWVYFGYEISLVPIILIIIVWGVYPERMYSGIVIFLYTVFFSFPLIVILLYLNTINCTFILSSFTYIIISTDIIALFSLIVFCSFAVKLPIYGLHYWLPLAHVEAPTFGSILLAGVLLKLGGCGMYRFFTYYNFGIRMYTQVLAILLIGIVVSSLVCCIQSDMKRLVAYSSVVHITSVGVGLLTTLSLGFKRGLIIIVMHGVSSPIMFYIVGEVYEFMSSRLIVLIRGLYFLTPLMFWGITLTFFLTVPVPPVLGFLGEVILFTSLLSLTIKALLVSFVYIFLGVVFNLYWLSSSFGELSTKLVMNLTFASRWLIIYFPILGFICLMLSFIF